jgi:hypothetical protein
MKAKKKHVGTKARLRAIKQREGQIAAAIFLAIILLVIVFSTYFVYTLVNNPQSQISNLQKQVNNQSPSQLKAAIVDQLGLTFPNQTFVENVTDTLRKAGYTVDYFSGEKVTVEFYRNLPSLGYRIVILRVHSTARGFSEGQPEKTPIFFFTSEPYSTTKYVTEQLNDQILKAAYTLGSKEYFAIGPDFVASLMNGNFQNATVIAMGCESLIHAQMADAFILRGVKAYIGWSEQVLASHTDEATTHLIKHLVAEKQTVGLAVVNTMKEVGTDPVYYSQMRYCLSGN